MTSTSVICTYMLSAHVDVDVDNKLKSICANANVDSEFRVYECG